MAKLSDCAGSKNKYTAPDFVFLITPEDKPINFPLVITYRSALRSLIFRKEKEKECPYMY